MRTSASHRKQVGNAPRQREHAGRTRALNGAAAEAAVAGLYVRAGSTVAARRWRGNGGEIDLIVRRGAALIFVEVKQAADFRRAAERVSHRQMARIQSAAAEFLAGEPRQTDTESRFDVALVDRGGRIEVLENAFGH